jgi:cytochrome c2
MTGRAVASAADFEYSAAPVRLRARGYRLCTAPLKAYPRLPEGVAPGTATPLVGLCNTAERADLIALAHYGRPRE